MPKGNPGVPRKDLLERLKSKSERVTESGCWIWMGKVQIRIDGSEGYGRIAVKGKEAYVHRVMWTLTNGPIPDGLHVCHKCDVRLCINLNHLYLGTSLQNLQDASRRSRMGKVFTAKDVIEIRRKLAAGSTLTNLCKEYNVRMWTISSIRDRTIWKFAEESVGQ